MWSLHVVLFYYGHGSIFKIWSVIFKICAMLQTEQRIIQAYPLWQSGQLLLGCGPITIDCKNSAMGTLRRAWLVPVDCEGGKDYDLFFAQPDPSIPNVMTGIWIQTSDGAGIVLNVVSITDIVSACDSCCNNNSVVPATFSVELAEDSSTILPVAYSPTVAINPPVVYAPSTYYFSREDNGSNYAKVSAEMDYMGQYIPGTFTLISHVGTTSNYSFSSRIMPALIGQDGYTGGGTYYKKVSNEAPPKGTNDLYSLMVYSNYFGNSGPWLGKTLDDIVYQLQTLGGFIVDVAVSTDQNRIMALTVQNNLSFVLGVQSISGTVFISNPAPPPNINSLYQLNIVANGYDSRDSLFAPVLQGSGMPNLVDSKALFPHWSNATIWVENGNQIAFSQPGITEATLDLQTNVPAIGRIIDSNLIGTITPGDTFRLTVSYYGDNGVVTLSPTIDGDTTAIILTQVLAIPAYTLLGTWSAQSDLLEIVTTKNNVYDILIQLDTVTAPIVPIISNAAPAVPVDQHLTATIILDGVTQFPELSGATPAALVTLLMATAPYSGYGTWSVVQTNKIQLETNQFATGQIGLGSSDVFVTNPAPTLTSGQIFRLDVHTGGIFLLPPVVGASLATVIGAIPTTGQYATLGGGWSTTATQIQLAGSTLTDVYLVLTAVPEPVIISNVAPSVPVGQRLTFTSLLNSEMQYPMVGIGNSAAVSTLDLATNPSYSTFGTWSYPDGDKVQLETSKFAGGTLSLSAKDFFLSNDAPTLLAGEIYNLKYNSNGVFFTTDLIGTTLAELITNLPPTIDPTIWGTLVVQVNQIRATNVLPGITDPVYISLEAITSPIFVSNTIGAIGSQHANVRVEIGPNAVYPIMSAASTGDLVARLNAYAPFSSMGTWSTSGSNAIQLATTKYNPMTLVLSVSGQFFSNPAPTLTGGQVFRLRGYWDTAFITPDVEDTTLAGLASKIAGSPEWAAFGGTWSVGGTGNDQIVNTGSTNKTLYLYLDAITAPVFLSNVAPVVPGGQHLMIAVTIGTALQYPLLSAGDVTFLRTRIAAIAPYSTMGTWAVSGGNKMQLSGAFYDPITLALTATDIFYSNPIGALSAGQSYQLETYLNTAFITPNVVGATLAAIVAAIPTTGSYATIAGTWSNTAADIRNTGSAETGVYLILSIITTPFESDSNSLPALGGGEQYVFTATLDSVELSPTITGTTMPDLMTAILGNAVYTDKGTWSINTDKIHLISQSVTTATLVITTEAIPGFMARSTGNRTAESKKTDNTAANKRKK